MKEARCRECGAIYTLESDKMPKSVKCVCESTRFKIAEVEA
jgi:hypothetical protein